MHIFSSIAVRISLAPWLLVLVSALSILVLDIRNETSLRRLIAKHDEATRMKEIIQRAVGDMAGAQQSASDYLSLSDAGVDQAKMNQVRALFPARIEDVRHALADLGQITSSEDASGTLTTLAAYVSAAEQMARMAELDRMTGIALLHTTTDMFNQMMDRLRVWRSHIDSRATESMAAAMRDNDYQRLISWALVGAVNLTALLLGFFLSRSITRPLRRLENRMIALTEGDLESDISDKDLTNEIGRMARSVDVFKANAREREQADRQLHIQAARFSAALGTMSEVLCMFDACDSLLVGNHRLAEILGLPANSIAPGQTIDDMRALLASTSGLLTDDLEQLHNLILRLKSAGERASRALDMADGRRLAVNFASMDDDGWLVTLEDISEQRRAEAKIEHMAHHDALTGLANRLLFHSRLREVVARCRRGERCAVLYLDLDHFKAVNDTLGHPAGDVLLRDVTQRLKLQVRDVDTVARLGGDEFAILQSISQASDSTALARRLIDAIGAPYEINGHRVIIGTSIGIALVPDDGEDVDEVIKNADMALYRSKADGRGRYQFFEAAMNARMQTRRTLELDLRQALSEGEFAVFYQPLINIANVSVCGFEALVRWQHPERGMISPAEFIPLAEEIGLIVPLGEWVLRQACAAAATWPGNLKVAVNLSPVQFGSPSLVDDVAAVLAGSGLAPDRLELEITETAMLADTDAVLVTLYLLRDLGLKIALDDFGTGYSSLSYLQRFPFSKVKLDQSFVGRLGEADDNDTIVSAMIDLCGRLGMMTTGEGVETLAQFRRLASLKCTEAQGYLFSQARPASEVREMLALRLDRFELAEIDN